jgi:hypothetical protein
MKKKKRKPARRNPVAKALRTLKPKTEPNAMTYRRKPKHKGRPDTEDADGLRLSSLVDDVHDPSRR